MALAVSENIAGAVALKELNAELKNTLEQINSNLSDKTKHGTISAEGITDLFTIFYHQAVLLVGWVVASAAGAPTVCIVVDSGANGKGNIVTTFEGDSVYFQLADDGCTIQFVNPYGNACFWHALML